MGLVVVFSIGPPSFVKVALDVLASQGHQVRVFEPPLLLPRLESTVQCDLFVIILGAPERLGEEGNSDWVRFVHAQFQRMLRYDVPTLSFIRSGMDSKDGLLLSEELNPLLNDVLKLAPAYGFESDADLSRVMRMRVQSWEETFPALKQSSSPAVPPHIDPLELAWLLVVERKAEPALLLHMDADAIWEAVQKWTNETGVAPASNPYEAAHARLRSKNPTVRPSPVWVAWMRATRSHLLSSKGPAEQDSHLVA
jgi:hypothetical protein